MSTITKPVSKEQVRSYMQQRQKERTAPPSIEEIRRQLGFGMIVPTR